MEKNKPISVAFEDIRNHPDIIKNSAFRIINDDLGMVFSFVHMGYKLFRIGQPYRAKEGRIVRILQGTGRISINLIEHEVSKFDIIIIPDNSLIELLEISADYDFQMIMPVPGFLPVTQRSILSIQTSETASRCHSPRLSGATSMCSLRWCGICCIPLPIGVKSYSI